MPKVKNECRNPTCPSGEVALSKLKVCSRCKQAAYCSVECQTSHWKEHKVECKACVEAGAKLITKKNIKEETGWTFNPNYVSFEDKLMEHWEASVPRGDLKGGITARQHMERLGVCPEMVRGLEIGDWQGATRRMIQMNQAVNIRNEPKLKVGDYVEVRPGNNVNASLIGLRGRLETFFKNKGKWGIDLEHGQPTMIMAGNLKRVTIDTPRESPW